MAHLLIHVMFGYQNQGKFLSHEFVLMPDHLHLLTMPTLTLERVLQLIKGGFSYRARKESWFGGEIREKRYYGRRARDIEEFNAFRAYIHWNPVKVGLVTATEEYPYGSAHSGLVLDELPQRLKPVILTSRATSRGSHCRQGTGRSTMRLSLTTAAETDRANGASKPGN